jgi:hypothetical protein
MPLDLAMQQAHNYTVAATQQYEIGVSYVRRTNRHSSGFFSSVARLLFLGGCVGSLTTRRNLTPVRQPAQSPSLIGVRKGGSKPFVRSRTMKTRTPSAPRYFRFPLYRLARHFTGPILAFRIARLGQ